jgi:hypothetical protein
MLPNPQPAAPPETPENGPGNGAGGATPLDFDEWIKGQDETVKGLITTRFQNLENTVKATRGERDTLAADIKKLAREQKEGSEAKLQLDKISAQLEATERRAAFLEEALNPAIQCKNARAAWLLADAGNLFTKRGTPDWDAIKAEAPELFGLPTARANAGNGTQQPPSPSQSMNSFIRKASGRDI